MYSTTQGSATCTACPTGTYSPDAWYKGQVVGSSPQYGTTSCTSCAAGTYSSVTGATSCTSCAAGTYSPTTGETSSSTCTSCAAGTYSTVVGATSSSTCTACAAGTYSSVAGATICTSCAAGTYSSVVGASSCTSCPIGAYSTLGATVCMYFRTVQTIAQNFNKPYGIAVDNSKNVYVTDAGNNVVKKIDETGTSFTIAGTSWYRFNSPRGIDVSPDGSNVFVADYENSRIIKLVNAPSFPNRYNPSLFSVFNKKPFNVSVSRLYNLLVQAFDNTSNSIWRVDQSGTNYSFPSAIWSDNISKAVDSNTSQKTYFIVKNQIYVLYPSGLTEAVTGRVNAGYVDGSSSIAMFNNPSSIVIDAYDNLYVTDTGNKVIRKIASDGIVSTIQTTTTLNNPTGIAIDLNSNIYVIDGGTINKITLICPTGTYYDADTCKQCPSGTYSSTTGATGVTSCMSCPAGTYSSMMGATSSTNCTSCPVGTFSTPGSSVCTLCPSGTYSSTTGASMCTSCAAGTYSSVTGATTSSVCTSCPSGTYSSTTGASVCTSCAAGTYSAATGVTDATSCMSCAAGTFSTSGSSVCSATCPQGVLQIVGSACLMVCPPGKYKSGTSCSTCPAGTYYIGTGANSVNDCLSCGPGTYSGLGFSTCLKCPTGTSFAGTRGTSDSVCTPCTAGTYSNIYGSTSCSSCLTGTSSSANSTFCYRATGGDIQERGPYIIHTFTASGNFNPFLYSLPITIVDFISITKTQIYTAPYPFTINENAFTNGGATPVTISDNVTPTISGIVPYLKTETTLTNDYGTFSVGTPQLIIVYLKTPCTTGSWNPLKKQCEQTCTLPFTSSQNGICVKCSTSTLALSEPFACDTGFTLSGLTCTGNEMACPDSTWTLSGTICTKTETICPGGSTRTITDVCIYPDGTSQLPITTVKTQSAVSTSVTKPAYRSKCVTPEMCPDRTYLSNGECIKCPGNQTNFMYTLRTSINTCICPVGTFGKNGSGVCTPCGVEKWSELGTETEDGCFVNCPEGSYASDGSCIPCPYGTSPVGSNSINACVCPTGTFLNNGSCIAACPPGMYGNVTTYSCVTCPGTQVSVAGTVGIGGCTCPDGTSGENGSGTCTPCNGNQVSVLTNNSCPDDSWTLTGSVCTKVSAYECPGDSYNTGNTCYSTQYTMPSIACTFDSYSCPPGWTLNGSVCLKNGQPMQTATVNVRCPTSGYACPPGYTLSGTTCTSTTSSGYTCSSGDGSITEGIGGSLTTIGNSVLEGTVCKQYTCSGVNVFLKDKMCINPTITSTCPSDKPYYYNGTCYDATCPAGSTLLPPGATSDPADWQNLNVFRCRVQSCSWQYSNGIWDSSRNSCIRCLNGTTPGTCNQAVAWTGTLGIGTFTNTCSVTVLDGAGKSYNVCTNPVTIPIGNTYTVATSVSYGQPITNILSTNATVYSTRNASPKYDQITASTATQITQLSGTLTRQLASIRSVDMTNTVLSQTTRKQCTCETNRYWDFITKTCVTQCPPATYSDTSGKICRPCPANKTSPVGSTSINQCVCSYASPFWSGVSCMQQFNSSSPAVGGNITYNKNYTIHTFTTPDDSNNLFRTFVQLTANVLAVGGGSGGNSTQGLGGNGGDVAIKSVSFTPYTTYGVTVGKGGVIDQNGTFSGVNIVNAFGGLSYAQNQPVFNDKGKLYINNTQLTRTDTTASTYNYWFYKDFFKQFPALGGVTQSAFCTTERHSYVCDFMTQYSTIMNFTITYLMGGSQGKPGWCFKDDRWGSTQMCFGGGGGGVSGSGSSGGGDGLYIDFLNNNITSKASNAVPNSGSGGGGDLIDFRSSADQGGSGGSGLVKISYLASVGCPSDLPFYDFELLSPVCTTCIQYDSRLPLFDPSTGLCMSCPANQYYDPTTKTCVATCPAPMTPNPQFNNICAIPPLTCQGARPYFNGYECSASQVNFTTQGGATGGNSVINNGVNVIHVFTTSGTFTPPLDKVLTGDILIVGGGGGGGTYSIEDFVNPRTAGGGGGGEVQYRTGVSFGQQTWAVNIGQGGIPNQNGGDTSFGTYVAKGGGAGGSPNHIRGYDGSSGGGSVYNETGGFPTSPNGFKGGSGAVGGGGGGGGQYSQGGYGSEGAGGYGGSGVSNNIMGSVNYYGGGGGGSGVKKSLSVSNTLYISAGFGGAGGLGGGGTGAGSVVYNYSGYQKTNMVRGENGTPNTGGGGGGGADVASPGPGNYNGNPVTTPGSYGGSGIVIIRYSTTGLCPANLPYFNPGLKTCTNCPDTAPLYNTSTGACMSCPSATPYWNGINCVAACPSVLPRADQNKVCQLPCVGAAPNWDGNQCTTVCPETKPIATNGVCGACPSATPNWNPVTKTCVTACPETVQGNVCRSCYDADPTKPYWDGSACQSCPESTPAWTGPLTGCQSCPTITPIFYQGQCRACYDINPLRPLYNKTPGGYKFSSINRCQPCPVSSTPSWNNTTKACQTCIVATSIATPYWDTMTNACTACPASKPYWNSRVCSLPTNIITAPLTATTTANVTASATTSTSPPWQAFDGSSTTSWQSGVAYTANGPYTGKRSTRDSSDVLWNGEFLQIEFPYRYIISSYTLSSPNLLRWVVLGSGDGFIWDLIDNKTTVDTTNYSQTFYITPPLSNSYPLYRLVATKSSGASVSVTEWSPQTANAVVTTQTTRQKSALTVISGAIEGCDNVACVIDKSSSTDITDIVYGNYPATQVGTDLLPDKAQEALSNCSSNVDCGFVQFDFVSNASTFSTRAPYTVSTMTTTMSDVGLFQKKYGVSPPPRLRSPPGLEYSYYYIEGTKLGSNLTATIELCGRACTVNPSCKGFNFYYTSSNCEFYSTISSSDKYDPNKGSFVRDSHILIGEQNTARLQYTDLDASGTTCQNMTACNTDVSSLIGQLGSTVQSFSTAELDSCNYCPIRSVTKQGSVYTVTNEVDIASNVTTTTDVQSKMMFSNVNTTTHTEQPGIRSQWKASTELMEGNYRISPYVELTSNAIVNIRGSQLWVGNEPFAAGIAPKTCINQGVIPLYTLGTKLYSNGQQCLNTRKGAYTYITCSGSCATGTDLDPGVRNVTTGVNEWGGADPSLLEWDIIPVDWVKNGYYIKSRGSSVSIEGIGWNYINQGPFSGERRKPYLKWGAYLGKYRNYDNGLSSAADLLKSAIEGYVLGTTLGFVNLDLLKNDPTNIFFNSFPPQIQSQMYPVLTDKPDQIYDQFQTLPSQQPGGTKYDDKEYIFVIEPV